MTPSAIRGSISSYQHEGGPKVAISFVGRAYFDHGHIIWKAKLSRSKLCGNILENKNIEILQSILIMTLLSGSLKNEAERKSLRHITSSSEKTDFGSDGTCWHSLTADWINDDWALGVNSAVLKVENH